MLGDFAELHKYEIYKFSVIDYHPFNLPLLKLRAISAIRRLVGIVLISQYILLMSLLSDCKTYCCLQNSECKITIHLKIHWDVNPKSNFEKQAPKCQQVEKYNYLSIWWEIDWHVCHTNFNCLTDHWNSGKSLRWILVQCAVSD